MTHPPVIINGLDKTRQLIPQWMQDDPKLSTLPTRTVSQDLYATAIETDFGICVQMKNCAAGLVEHFLDNDDIYYPGDGDDDEAPLTLAWLSSRSRRSRWQESTSAAAAVMNRNVHKMPNFSRNSSRFVCHQTMINYHHRGSFNLRDEQQGHENCISEGFYYRHHTQRDHHHRQQLLMMTTPTGGGSPDAVAGVATRTTASRMMDSVSVKAGPKKMWIRHYELTHDGKVMDGDILHVVLIIVYSALHK